MYIRCYCFSADVIRKKYLIFVLVGQCIRKPSSTPEATVSRSPDSEIVAEDFESESDEDDESDEFNEDDEELDLDSATETKKVNRSRQGNCVQKDDVY